jgi:RNA polymerase sigma-70 factor (ECF subfamily)
VLLALVPPQEARDQVQEVFLAALARIEGLDRPERVGAWLCTIARNRARDLLRRRPPTVALEEEPADGGAAAGAAAVDGDGDGEAAEAARALAALRALPPSYAETLTLRLVEGLSGPEIAARTGMTHGSVRVNLCRGMKLLRERLARGSAGDGQP